MDEIRERLKRFKEYEGYTYTELGRMLKLSYQTIRWFLMGGKPTRKTWVKIRDFVENL